MSEAQARPSALPGFPLPVITLRGLERDQNLRLLAGFRSHTFYKKVGRARCCARRDLGRLNELHPTQRVLPTDELLWRAGSMVLQRR